MTDAEINAMADRIIRALDREPELRDRVVRIFVERKWAETMGTPPSPPMTMPITSEVNLGTRWVDHGNGGRWERALPDDTCPVCGSR